MPEYPNNSCYVGHPNWPTCLNGKPKTQIKQILKYDLTEGNITKEQINALITNPVLDSETQQKINEISEEI